MKYCKEEELRLNAKKKEEDERRRKMEKMKNDMKNKEFTFDSNGNILPVQKANPDKLVQERLEMHYQFHEGFIDPDVVTVETARQKKNDKRGNKK